MLTPTRSTMMYCPKSPKMASRVPLTSARTPSWSTRRSGRREGFRAGPCRGSSRTTPPHAGVELPELVDDGDVRDPRAHRARCGTCGGSAAWTRVHVGEGDDQRGTGGDDRGGAGDDALGDAAGAGAGGERGLFQPVLRVSEQSRELLSEVRVFQHLVGAEHPRGGLLRGHDDVAHGRALVGGDGAFSEPLSGDTGRVDAVPRVARRLLDVADPPPRVR